MSGKKNVVIMGAGAFGHAIAHLLQRHSVEMWDKDESKVPGQRAIEDIIAGADVVFLSVPSWGLREAAETVRKYATKRLIVISPTKGIEEKTLKVSDEILAETLGDDHDIALLNGPMLAAEIQEDLPSYAVVATQTEEAWGSILDLFSGSTLSLEYSDDLHGTSLAGVLKNIYSIGLGMTEAMKLGSNFRGWFVQQACKEMADIIELLGGKRSTAYNAAGLADLVATGFSPHSRNCRVGQELVMSGECSTVSEGAESFPQLIELIYDNESLFPIYSMLADIVVRKHQTHTRFQQLLEK